MIDKIIFQLRVSKGRARKADLIKVEKLISTIHNLALSSSSSRTYKNVFYLKEMRLESPVTKEEADEV